MAMPIMRCSAKLSTDAAKPASQPRLSKLGRGHWPYLLSAFLFLLLSFLQSPGLIVADTKHNLTANPGGFLTQALHLWSENAPMGQLQNQAYGYLFPQGAFFALGDAVGIAPWVTQRLWWALLLWLGFWGFVHVARALGIGVQHDTHDDPDARLLSWPLVAGGLAYALSPRVLTTLGAISSETLPVMLAPWVLLPVVLAFPPQTATAELRAPHNTEQFPSTRQLRTYALLSALAVAGMGAVNAVATLAAVTPALLWWITHLPWPTRDPQLRPLRKTALKQWGVFTGWWVLGGVLACLWWLGPLFILGNYSPPFLDFIESAGVTTRWANLTETLRGTTSWTPFITGERVAGAALVSEPVFVLATTAVAAAGLAGLTLRSMRHRPRLIGMLLLGVTVICLPWVGDLGVPFAEQVRSFLDGAGSAFRNLHKFDPLIRLPLSLGVAHLLSRVPLPQPRTQLAQLERWPRVAGGVAVVLALVVSVAPAWSFRLAPEGGYREVPDHWAATASWLENHAEGRALLVPGSNFARQLWGLTRDEPLQPLATTPWAVRDIIPLVPPETIRAMDSVQELFADGRASAGLAGTLASQNIRHLIVRNDLDLKTSGAASPARVHQTLRHSPGLKRVANFGKKLRNGFPAVEIYAVDAPFPAGPWLVDTNDIPIIAGGPEALEPLAALARSRDAHLPPITMLAHDASAPAGTPPRGLTVTDSPTLREVDFGSLDHHASALRSRHARRHTDNRLADYPAGTQSITYARWFGATVTSSSSAAHADQLRHVQPAYSEGAAVDGDPHTSWRSLTFQGAVGQWLQLDLHKPIQDGSVSFTVPQGLPGATVTRVAVVTERGSTTVSVRPGVRTSTPLPPGETTWVRIVAVAAKDGSPGVQFGLNTVSVRDGETGRPVNIGRQIVVPAPQGSEFPARWVFHQRFPGSAYAEKDVPVTAAEEGSRLVRVVTVPQVSPQQIAAQAGMAVQPRVLVRWNPHYRDGSTKGTSQKQLRKALSQAANGCSTDADAGLSIRVGSSRVPLQLVGDSAELRKALSNGQAVVATACPGGELRLPTGQEVLVEASAGNLPLAIDTVELRVELAGASSSSSIESATWPQGVRRVQWSDTQRTIHVPASNQSRLLVVPESTNNGWVARTKQNRELRPTVANGWQQAWVVPAGYGGEIELEFVPDRPYRVFLLAGALALALLVVLALASLVVLHRRGECQRVVTIDVAMEPVGDRIDRFCGTYLPLITGALLMVSGVLLANQPWGLGGYAGNKWYVQLPALLALVAAAVSPWLETWLRSSAADQVRAAWRRFSQRL